MLLTSPWPESLYAFAPMWATLAEQARLFAVDLPGFGKSERRDDLLSPRAMGAFLAQLIAEADLGRPYVVAPTSGPRPPCSRPRASGALRGRHRRLRRSRRPAPARRAAEVPGARPRPRQVPPDGPARQRRHRNGQQRRRNRPTTSARTTWTLRRRPLAESMRYVRRYPDELPELAELPPQSRRRSRSSTAATTAWSRSPRSSSSTRGFPTAASRSSTPATSPGKRRRPSTPRSSSTRSRARLMTASPPSNHPPDGRDASSSRRRGVDFAYRRFGGRRSCRWCCCSTSAATSTTGIRR